ncbi:hypothetical protein TWF481_003105 [Arthrobotrys musiformis]|uniref:Uncharacterized protein n=1 Tax=Arthrobotrys musiformis TaxID=47236 RepID=A0AAV9VR46_9PEZI
MDPLPLLYSITKVVLISVLMNLNSNRLNLIIETHQWLLGSDRLCHYICGHDRSLLYFRARSHTKECLCHAFSRLPHRNTVCPECDRALKLSRGAAVPQDHLTPENRAKCQAWREIVDNQVKDAENKRLVREAKENGKDESTVTIGREVHVAARHLKHADAHQQKHQSRQRNGKMPNGIVPPYVPQPGETFLDHIISEIIDDAKSGGEMGRLQTAMETGLQGYGHIGPEGDESWLYLSGEWMAKNADKVDMKTGYMGPGYLSQTDFPALPLAPGGAKAPTDLVVGKKTPYKLKFDPTKDFVPSIPLPGITVSPSTNNPTAETSTSGLLTELPPLAILPLLFEKYEEDGEEVITEGSPTASSFPTTPGVTEEDPYARSIGKICGPASGTPSQSLSENASRSPSSSLPSKVSTPAPDAQGPYLKVPEPLPKNFVVPFQTTSTSPHMFYPPQGQQRGFTPPAPTRHYTPPVQHFQRGYHPSAPGRFTPQTPQERSFTPPMAKLRSYHHINNRHQSKTPNNRFNNSYHNNHGRRFYQPQVGPYTNPLVSGPIPYGIGSRVSGLVAAPHAAGSMAFVATASKV